jgi:hyaluronan synthase
MLRNSLADSLEYEVRQAKSGQKITPNGRIHVPKKAWIVRVITICALLGIVSYNFTRGFDLKDPFVIYAGFMVVDALIMLIVGWFFFKNPNKAPAGNELVSVLIPVYNQKNMISIVVDSIVNSTYKNIEIIAVNDGSTDGTKEILDDMAKKYPTLKVYHKKNGGKRKANYLGFIKSKGKFVVFIDSDSVIDQYAIEELMKSFNTQKDVGALVGHVKAWNSKNNLLARMQDAWYDFEFNILKSTQSTLNNVLVCSGCFAGYRREAIEKFIPLWNDETSNWKELDTKKYFKSNPWKNKFLGKISTKLLEWSSQFDDSEDITLTSQTLIDWKTKYVASSIVYTDVPENMKGFIKQQLRWRKGWIRASFFVSSFIWKKNPLVSIMFYIHLITLLPSPFILMTMIFYAPFVLHEYFISLVFFAGLIGIGFAHGLDYKFRDPHTTNWKYRPMMNFLLAFVLPWLSFPALMTIRKNKWLTR